ncbi:hypothetical protein SEA_FUZZBUSTER_3 [Microbacterium phage FuzzBuster]|uniref:Uncharacterized protein n=1 Tax=Microbacterium phage FuzzBuster TaxID=2590935 RepID=A0A516KUY2_9CAUD|nr:hypothetical protein SEA_FUZZBUSTER_3 [Microbacterium phage FuzzBuster]
MSAKKKSLRDIGRKRAERRGGRIELEPMIARMREDYGGGIPSLATIDPAARSYAAQRAYRAAPRPGDTLDGFCRGAFGRDSYGAKTVIAAGVRGESIWIVVDEAGHLLLAQDVTADDIEGWRADAEQADREAEEWERYDRSTEGDR